MSNAERIDDKNNRTGSHRDIRSFVLRQGRITPAQERAFAAHWSQFGLNYTGTPPDFDAIFNRHAPLVLEIGFGNGEQLLYAAQAEPHKNFIGIEVHRPGVGRLMNGLAAQQINNVRLYNHDAVDVLKQEITPDMLAEVRIYFPDPWPKQRHHKRRLIQNGFLNLLAARIKTNGLLHLATDWAEYAQHMIMLLENAPGWSNQVGAGHFSPRPSWRTQTHFEKRGLRLGHGVWDLLYKRV